MTILQCKLDVTVAAFPSAPWRRGVESFELGLARPILEPSRLRPKAVSAEVRASGNYVTMAKFRFHKLAALAVLVGFAAWVGTGEFSSVGSAQNETPAEKPAETVEQPKAPLRTVAVITPPRPSTHGPSASPGQTEADKRAMLATRVMGIIEQPPVRQGEHVNKGDLIMRLDAEDKEAAIRMAEIAGHAAPGRDRRGRAAGQGRQRAQAAGRPGARRSLPPPSRSLKARKAELAQYEIYAPFNGVIDRVPVERRQRHHGRRRGGDAHQSRPAAGDRRGQRARPATI